MTDYESMTVIDLRKFAKENGVVLGAGLNKAAIIEKLQAALDGEDEPEQPQELYEEADAAAEAPEPQPAAPAAEESAAPAESQPQFRAAWHNPSSRYGGNYNNARPATYSQRSAAPAAGRSEWQANRAQPQAAAQPPRFGPGSASGESSLQGENSHYGYENRAPQESGGYRARTGFGPAQPNSYRTPAGPAGSSYTRRRDPAQGYEGEQPQTYRGYETPAPAPAGFSGANFSVNELLSSSESVDGGGILDLHPDGYGFLRGSSFLASSKDIYVSAAQVRRFNLRDGDLISGKVKPQREGDRYAAMLSVATVNGLPADSTADRPLFEDLTAIYPTRKINLDSRAERLRDTRVIDLATPMGFGQRALLLCPPHVHKSTILRDIANVIMANHPGVEVFLVLIGETPEEVTRLHDSVNCRVVASTFDQPPENHLRLSDLVMDYARRLAEQQKDVVVIVDSLTRIAKACPTAQAMQGRAVPGVINPSSLNRAKKLFGSARALREGGSLTVLGVMNTDVSKADDAVLEEFRAAANLVLTLDGTLARAGLFPPINLQQSATIRADLMVPEQKYQSLSKLKSELVASAPAAALQQLLALVERVNDNDELLAKAPEWLAMMKA